HTEHGFSVVATVTSRTSSRIRWIALPGARHTGNARTRGQAAVCSIGTVCRTFRAVAGASHQLQPRKRPPRGHPSLRQRTLSPALGGSSVCTTIHHAAALLLQARPDGK